MELGEKQVVINMLKNAKAMEQKMDQSYLNKDFVTAETYLRIANGILSKVSADNYKEYNPQV